MQNKNNILNKVIKLYNYYKEGKIPTLTIHEVHPNFNKDSRENFLYFTLAPSLNFQRNSPALWQSALKTFKDNETSYLFFPEKVVFMAREKIQKDLLKHKLALQKNKHTDIWVRICATFHEVYNDDPRELLSKNNWNVSNILQEIQIDKKVSFPYLSGAKMANYWLYILSQYTNAEFKNMQEISIIPDTHVQQCSIKLGICKENTPVILIAKLWKELLDDGTITPVEMHPVLWNWSRNNFKPEV